MRPGRAVLPAPQQVQRPPARRRPLPRRGGEGVEPGAAVLLAGERPAGPGSPAPFPCPPPPVCRCGRGRARNSAPPRKMEVGEPGPGGRAGSSADSLAEEEEEDEEGPGSGRSSRTSSLVSGLLTELYSAAEAAAPSGSARSRALRELQRRPSQVKYLRLKGTACPRLPCPARCHRSAGAGSCPAASLAPSVPAREPC